MKYLSVSFLLLLAQTTMSQGVDRLVDASGAASIHTTIGQAMAVSSPGDRILVLPGVYPEFQFFKGVHVIGLGADPSAVVIDHVAYHVSIPNLGYDSLLSNVTIESSNPLNVTALSGNELAPGTLVLDGVHMKGGVFLRGGQSGFYCLMSNCLVDPPPGYGFSGEAVRIGGPGNFFEIRNSTIRGWDAEPTFLIPAGVGLRIAGGSRVRISNSVISGGSGLPTSSAGAAAIISAAPGTVELRLDGGAIVSGGAGSIGGNGVQIQGTVDVFGVTVSGGAGSPPGLAYSVASPSSLGIDHNMQVTPAFVDAQGDPAVHSGETLSFAVDAAGQSVVIGISLDLALPSGPLFLPLVVDSAILVDASSVSLVVPWLPGGATWTGVMVYAEAGIVDPVTQSLSLTNTATVRVDLD